jgi:hypothetical protein
MAGSGRRGSLKLEASKAIDLAWVEFFLQFNPVLSTISYKGFPGLFGFFFFLHVMHCVHLQMRRGICDRNE